MGRLLVYALALSSASRFEGTAAWARGRGGGSGLDGVLPLMGSAAAFNAGAAALAQRPAERAAFEVMQRVSGLLISDTVHADDPNIAAAIRSLQHVLAKRDADMQVAPSGGPGRCQGSVCSGHAMGQVKAIMAWGGLIGG